MIIATLLSFSGNYTVTLVFSIFTAHVNTNLCGVSLPIQTMWCVPQPQPSLSAPVLTVLFSHSSSSTPCVWVQWIMSEPYKSYSDICSIQVRVHGVQHIHHYVAVKLCACTLHNIMEQYIL